MAKNVQLTVDIKGGDSVGKAAEKTKNLKQELKELKIELASGSLTGKAFDEAAERAAGLQETLDDVNQQLRSLANSKAEIALNGFMSLAEGIVGGFTAAQGAMALFGDENEEVQKALLKVQSAMALLNGIQAVNNALKKEEGFLTAANIAKTKIMTAVQGRYAAVVGTTTGAMKLLRLAGAAIPITLLITGIGILIANFDKIKKVVLGFIPGLSQLGDLFTKVKNAVMDFVGISSEAERQEEKAAKQRAVRSQQMQYEIELMEANGASARDLYLAKRKLLFNDLETLKIAAFKKGATQDEIKGYNEMVQAIRVLDAEETKRIKEGADKEKEAANKRAEERKKEQEKLKAEREKEKQEALKRADDDIKEQLKRFDDEQAKLKQAKLDAEFELEDEKDRQAQRDRERAVQLSQEIIDAEKSVQDARLESIIAAGQLIGQLAGQNKKIATAALAIEKGAAIADVIIKGIRERAGITAKYSLVPGGQAAALPELAASRIRTGISIASIAAAGIQGARSINGGGSSGGGSVQPPNIRGSQTTNEPTSQPATKVFVTETDIRSSLRKVDGIYSQSTII
jgi:hypothetical protein